MNETKCNVCKTRCLLRNGLRWRRWGRRDSCLTVCETRGVFVGLRIRQHDVTKWMWRREVEGNDSIGLPTCCWDQETSLKRSSRHRWRAWASGGKMCFVCVVDWNWSVTTTKFKIRNRRVVIEKKTFGQVQQVMLLLWFWRRAIFSFRAEFIVNHGTNQLCEAVYSLWVVFAWYSTPYLSCNRVVL